MRAAIAINDWKLPIFERRLSEGGFVYEKGAGLTVGTLHLYVETDDLNALATVIRAAEVESRSQRKRDAH